MMEPINESLKQVVRNARAAASATNWNENRPTLEPVCPRCKGAGFVRREVPVGHPQFGRAIPCICKRDDLHRRRELEMRRISNLGQLARLTFNSFIPEGYGLNPDRQNNLHSAYEICREYSADPYGWLVLVGGFGSGKTHLAAAMANDCIQRGHQALFVVVPDLLDHLRATFAPTSHVTYDERFEQIRNAPLLILDDLGTQASSPWAMEKLFQLFNHRYNAQLPTVITTNHALEEIDVRIRSRLVDVSISRVVHILAPDFRQSGVDQGQSDLSCLHLLSESTFQRFDLRALELVEADRNKLWNCVQICKRFAQQPSGWLVLVGDFGVGKTHLAAAIANHRVADGQQQALFIVVPDLLDHLRATYSPTSSVSYDKRFEQIRRTPLLVLDDLGTHSATPWAQEKLYQLFNYRYMARLATVITLNRIDDVEPRLLERMVEMKHVGHGNLVELDIPPYRGSGRGNRTLRTSSDLALGSEGDTPPGNGANPGTGNSYGNGNGNGNGNGYSNGLRGRNRR